MRKSLAAITASVVLVLTASACGSDDDQLTSSERKKAEAAALEYIGAGKVTETERTDEDDEHVYEVDVELPDGTDVELHLNKDFEVTNHPPLDPAPDPATPSPSAKPPASPSNVAPDDDRGLLGKTAIRAKAAALKATGGGEVLETSGSDDADHVYEVEVRTPSGEDVTVELDADFKVVRIDR